jgi:HEAT repeats/PBS lyase HEAT-like repeat
MGRKRQVLFVFVAITIMAGLAWAVLREPPEPVYQGKKLSVWLEESYVSRGSIIGVGPNPGMDPFIRQFGTNAIPTLLRMLRARDSKIKLKLWDLSQTQNMVRFRVPLSWVGAYFPTGEAAEAFGALGASASNAVPQLLQTYRDNVGPDSQANCLRSLGLIGPAASQAIPDLLAATTNANPHIRRTAIEALVNIRVQPALVTPILISGLKDAQGGVRFYSIKALATFGPEAEAAVPELVKLLQNPNTFIVTNVGNTLKAIDPDAATRAGVK